MIFRRLAFVAFAAVALALAGTAVFGHAEPPGLRASLIAKAAPADTSEAAYRPVRVAVIGDSYTQGTQYGGMGGANWTVRLQNHHDIMMMRRASGGVGYVKSDEDGRGFSPNLNTVLNYNMAEVVLFVGSRNDALQDPELVYEAALHLFEKAQKAGKRVLVVGPIWDDGEPPPGVLDVTEAMRRAAKGADVPFSNGVRWLQGDGLIGADGVHPTDEGHAVIEERVYEFMREHGIKDGPTSPALRATTS